MGDGDPHGGTGRCPTCRRRPGYDLRGLIALLGIGLVFALAFVRASADVPADDIIPPWAAGFLTLVTTSYYMTKGAERHADALTRSRVAEPPAGPPDA